MEAKIKVAPQPGELGAMLTKINRDNPEPADVARLRAYLRTRPDEAAKIGNLANLVKSKIIDASFSSAPVRVMVEEHLRHMRHAYDYENASIVERMLIDAILIAWLRYYEIELKNMAMENSPSAFCAHHDSLLNSAQKRFLRAIESLAKVRRLMQKAPTPVMNALIMQQFNQK